MQPITRYPGLFKDGHGKRTKYFVQTAKRQSFFDERIVSHQQGLFREVDPERSKLFAAIAKGVSQLGLKEDSSILYLGASHGYTVSFLSDMVTKGQIFALDFAPRVMRDMVFIAEQKENIAPVYANASHPETYANIPLVDVVFMDVAQRNQVEIFKKNCDAFLKSGGFGLLALKARSMDMTKKPKDLFKQVRKELERNFIVVDYRELDPFEKDHAFYVVKKR